jgi:5-methylcytosine-specific restriction endonuclease McrA
VRIRFNRLHVLARDGYTCQYCAARPLKDGKPDLEDLTIDHVIPRAQSRDGRVILPSGKVSLVTTWENVVCACYACNLKKADRTPEQAGMKLARSPKAPSVADVFRMSLTRVVIPSEWSEYLPAGSDWRKYWDVELSAE